MASRAGGTAIPGLALPDGFPVVPGASPQAPPSDDPEHVASWTTADDGREVYLFYLSALEAAGFSITEPLPGGEVAAIRFSAPGGDALLLELTRSAGLTRIALRRDRQPP